MKIGFLIERAERISTDDLIAQGWFAVSHLWVQSKADRRVATGNWFRIESEFSKIYRILRFRPQLASDTAKGTGEIMIDYDGWNQLSGFAEKTPTHLRLRFQRATFFEFVGCISSHPDPGYRLAGWLGVVSVLLGAIGLALGIISMFK
jgi:hypothetical protein